MTRNTLLKFAGVMAALFVTMVATLIYPSLSHANPSSFFSPIKSASATTTVTYLNGGGAISQATSTTVDNYTSSGTTFEAYDRDSLMIQMAASSTSAILNVRFQFSTDGIDWYDDDIASGTSTLAVIDIRNATNYSWLASVTATSSKLISVPTVTRYIRAVFTETGAAAAIWYQWEPVKQNP